MATKHLIICAIVFLVGFAEQCFAQEPMDGGIVMYRQFTNGSLDTDLNIFLDFSSIGIANVWNVTKATNFSLTSELVTANFTVNVSNASCY